MAEVFKAKSFGVEGFEKVLVIKRILPKLSERQRFVDMFVHEAKLAVRLSHANIVQVFDLGRVDPPDDGPTSYFIAMEYVPGMDLSSVLKRCRRQKRPIPVGMAVYVAAEVAKALDHAHRRRDEQSRPLGIVHRDISPQNILLSWEGEVKVTDFGIAKAKDIILGDGDETQAGQIKGKLAYMSPEQSRGDELDGRSDLFSLGIVLYEMLAQTHPFTAPTSYETLRRLQSAEFPPLDILRPDAPKPLLELMSKVLAKSPDDRFPDAGRLHEALLSYFYASEQRFGARDLSEFLAPFHEEAAGAPELEAGDVFDEQTGANERTPVEVPQPASSAPKTGGSGLFAAGERPDTGGAARAVEMGERREVTALVLSLSPPEAEGGPLIARALATLERYGARIIEQEASQVTAIFGLGDADGRDTEAAVRAALVVLRGAGGGTTLSAGVHVSRILVDPTGEPLRDERLTSLVATAQAFARATDGRVAVSPLAGRIVRSVFASEELPRGGRSVPDGGRVITSPRPPAAVYGRFVGRQAELRRLGEVLARASRRQAQIVTVQGDKGIGKTRLLDEMNRRLQKGNYSVGFYKADCPKNGADVPWSGLTAMLQVLCGIQEGDDEERILDVLPRLRALGLQDDESAAVLSHLGATSQKPSQPPGSTTGNVKNAFAKMVQRLCDDRLHCFAWDDAQGMDAATLQAIRGVVGIESPTGLRAMMILASREPPSEIIEGPFHQTINLGELSHDDCGRLIATRVGARILPPELLAFCEERAGGHPLFLEELVKELLDSAAISVMNGAVTARLEGATAVPRTLRTLIAARMSRLDPADRAVLSGAAILGDPIHTEVLAALTHLTLPQVDQIISRLAAKDFLRVTGPAQARFASPMHAEIVIDSIPGEACREMHAAAAEAYISVVGEEDSEHAARIANHLYQAGNRDRAATLFARAARHQIRVNQLESAIRRYVRALDLADLDKRSPGELSGWIESLSDCVSRARSGTDLPAVTQRVLKRIDAAGTVEQRVAARVHTARALGSVNLFEQTYEMLEEARDLAGGSPELARSALAVEIEMSARSGDFARGVRAADKLAGMGNIDDPRLLTAIAHSRAAVGQKAEALKCLERADEIADPNDLAGASERQKQRVLVYVFSRDFKAGVDESSRAADLARTAGMRFDAVAALHNLGDAARRLGDFPRAYASFVESRDLAKAMGHERLAALNRIHLAYLDGLRGAAGSLELLRDLIRYADSRRFWTDALEGRCLLAALLAHDGKTDEARKEFLAVLELAESYGNNLIAEDAREALAELKS